MKPANPYDDNPAMRRAWTEGYDAYGAGAWIDDNPYDLQEHFDESRAWMHGWFAAHEHQAEG
jgi:ribosome modulation factor